MQVALEAQLRRHAASADPTQSMLATVGVLELLVAKHTALAAFALEHSAPLMSLVPTGGDSDTRGVPQRHGLCSRPRWCSIGR